MVRFRSETDVRRQVHLAGSVENDPLADIVSTALNVRFRGVKGASRQRNDVSE